MSYPTRPTQSIEDWGSTGVIATSVPAARVLLGVEPGKTLPAEFVNLFGNWIGYFDASTYTVTGAGGGGEDVAGLQMVRWGDPLDTANHYITWDQGGGAASDAGDLRAELDRSVINWGTGATQTCTMSVTGSTVTWSRGASATGSVRFVGYPMSIAPVSSTWQGIKYEADGSDYPEDTYDLTPGRKYFILWPPGQTWTNYTPFYGTTGTIGLTGSGAQTGTEQLRGNVPLPNMPHYTADAGYLLTRLEMSVTLSWTAITTAADNKVTITLYRSSTSVATATIDASGGAGTFTADLFSGGAHTVVAADGNNYWVDFVVQVNDSTDISVILDSLEVDIQPKAMQ